MLTMPRRSSRGLTKTVKFQLIVLTLLLLVTAALWISHKALLSFETSMAGPVAQKTTAIAEIVGVSLERALALRVPVEHLRGVEPYLEEIRSQHPEVAAIAVWSQDRQPLFSIGEGDALALALGSTTRAIDPATPGADHFHLEERALIVSEVGLGKVRLVVDQRHFERAFNEVRYDVLVVLVISFLIAIEFVTLIVTRTIVDPCKRLAQALAALADGKIRALNIPDIGREFGHLVAAIGRAQDRALKRRHRPDEISLGDGVVGSSPEINPVLVRVPLFLFMFAEELSRSFLPVFARELSEPSAAVDGAFLAGLPITLFMIVVAVATPIAGSLVDRFGVRSILCVGMIPGVVGFVGTASAGSMGELVIWRASTAIAYAVMFIGAQGFVAKNSPKGGRTRSMAHFVGAVIAAGVCGASVGGILADHIGYRQTFLVSAVIAGVSTLFVLWLFPNDRVHARQATSKVSANAGSTWRSPRFWALLLFAAIPAKLLLTGYLFFLIPVVLEGIGASSGLTGRVMMVYGLAVLAITPLAARLCDHWGRPEIVVSIGAVLAALGPLSSFYLASFEAAIVGVLLLGLGHALASAPQLSMVAMINKRKGGQNGQLASLLGIYRLIERSGAILGPMVAAILLSRLGPEAAAGWLGMIMLACAILFASVFARPRLPVVGRSMALGGQS